ncbi:uncharacterized protein C8Q71DRAFT_853315 [Rhodofomes roseus]|uniref:G domain-containing protein n=1 Tax=Rhodofomes roseus TaxID=34475 RepID=A0ABQ8KUN5_9APHY|nr:uncharacterized protein C8Q71DRAFT_853315 [Rhodofomes roseus]KAH9842795.1 hypothetical protein C8Q71DRAFT_853315 [Rhodofomes roseus]
MQRTRTIVVMGPPGTGKTTFVNAATGATLRIGDSLDPCTIKAQIAQTRLGHENIDVVDTPALDTEGERAIAEYLHQRKGTNTVVGVVFVIDLNGRVGQETIHSCHNLRKLCGPNSSANVIFVVHAPGPESQGLEERGNELRGISPFDEFFREGASMTLFDGTRKSARNILQSLTHKQPMILACLTERRGAMTSSNIDRELPSPDVARSGCCSHWWPWNKSASHGEPEPVRRY